MKTRIPFPESTWLKEKIHSCKLSTDFHCIFSFHLSAPPPRVCVFIKRKPRWKMTEEDIWYQLLAMHTHIDVYTDMQAYNIIWTCTLMEEGYMAMQAPTWTGTHICRHTHVHSYTGTHMNIYTHIQTHTHGHVHQHAGTHIDHRHTGTHTKFSG